MKNFLIILDRLTGKQELKEYPLGSTQAIKDYHAIQKKYLNEPCMDIVLLISDSAETLKRTHTSYFPGEYEKILNSLQPV